MSRREINMTFSRKKSSKLAQFLQGAVRYLVIVVCFVLMFAIAIYTMEHFVNLAGREIIVLASIHFVAVAGIVTLTAGDF